MKTAWNMTVRKKKFPPLRKAMAVDVAIVGGGLVGIQSAYLLAKAGKSVAVLEKETLGADATQHTTAFITAYIDTPAHDMQSIYGKKNSRLVYESGQDAIRAIESVIEEEQLDCEWKRVSNFVFAFARGQQKDLSREYKAIKEIGGISARLSLAPYPAGFSNYGSVEMKGQAKFHPLKYLYGLAGKAAALGVEIFEKTEVKKITDKNKILLAKSGCVVEADWVINATYDPLGNPIKTKFKKSMYTSYVMELEMEPGIIPEGIYEDMENPYHYFRVDSGSTHDRVLLGGADHRSELPVNEKKSFKELADYANQVFPKKSYHVVRKWNGPILEPSDGLPLIGAVEKSQLVAAAFSGNGMTYSMVAAHMFRDAVMGKKNPYTKIYDPARTPSIKQLASKGMDYAEELLKGALKNAIKY